MDIDETWKKLGRERLELPVEGNATPGMQSQHPVEKLKRNYFIKTIMMVFFLVCFAVLFFVFDEMLVRVTVGLMVIAYTVFLLSSFAMYRNIQAELPMDSTLRDVLAKTKERIERGLTFETRSSMLIFPFAGAAGYLMGFTVTGGDATKIFNNPVQIGIFITTLTVFTVMGWFIGRRLTYIGYGKSLEELRKLIEELNRKE